MPDESNRPAAKRRKLRFSMKTYFIIVTAILLIVIGTMLLLWRPWKSHENRTLSATGETTIKAEADEYLFVPNYEFTTSGSSSSLKLATTRSDAIVKELKAIGVPASGIKVSINGAQQYNEQGGPIDKTYTLNLAVTVTGRDVADKVQAYLISTEPLGEVSPRALFSTEKRKALEKQARSEALKDAKDKVQQNAEELGLKLGKVKSINNGLGFGSVYVENQDVAYDEYSGYASPSLQGVMPGENTLSYQVDVTYYVR